MNRIIHFPHAKHVECDHAVPLRDRCRQCENIEILQGNRGRLKIIAAVTAFWLIVGMLLIVTVYK